MNFKTSDPSLFFSPPLHLFSCRVEILLANQARNHDSKRLNTLEI